MAVRDPISMPAADRGRAAAPATWKSAKPLLLCPTRAHASPRGGRRRRASAGDDFFPAGDRPGATRSRPDTSRSGNLSVAPARVVFDHVPASIPFLDAPLAACTSRLRRRQARSAPPSRIPVRHRRACLAARGARLAIQSSPFLNEQMPIRFQIDTT
ncbi:hypothetical protein CF647_06995 [Burkholderia sp. 117]|nr:hypothetical protein CF649_07090 [Burkholderia sp. 136(2017)]PNX16151.1 hypothetical protein CF650_08540 [Burkholderia sp. 129]PNX31705.1 hypothetical protein CF647_06995 [Burkholderia sp. 117]PNX40615.1 hypothetical protein CF648_07085 [Burkholderia sp. 137]